MRRVIQEQSSREISFPKKAKSSLKGRKFSKYPQMVFLINGKHPITLLKKANTQRAIRSLVERYQVENKSTYKEALESR